MFDPEGELTKLLAGLFFCAGHLSIAAWRMMSVGQAAAAIPMSINKRQFIEILTPCGFRGFFSGVNTIRAPRACVLGGFKWWLGLHLLHDMMEKKAGMQPG